MISSFTHVNYDENSYSYLFVFYCILYKNFLHFIRPLTTTATTLCRRDVKFDK